MFYLKTLTRFITLTVNNTRNKIKKRYSNLQKIQLKVGDTNILGVNTIIK